MRRPGGGSHDPAVASDDDRVPVTADKFEGGMYFRSCSDLVGLIHENDDELWLYVDVGEYVFQHTLIY